MQILLFIYVSHSDPIEIVVNGTILLILVQLLTIFNIFNSYCLNNTNKNYI